MSSLLTPFICNTYIDSGITGPKFIDSNLKVLFSNDASKRGYVPPQCNDFTNVSIKSSAPQPSVTSNLN